MCNVFNIINNFLFQSPPSLDATILEYIRKVCSKDYRFNSDSHEKEIYDTLIELTQNNTATINRLNAPIAQKLYPDYSNYAPVVSTIGSINSNPNDFIIDMSEQNEVAPLIPKASPHIFAARITPNGTILGDKYYPYFLGQKIDEKKYVITPAAFKEVCLNKAITQVPLYINEANAFNGKYFPIELPYTTEYIEPVLYSFLFNLFYPFITEILVDITSLDTVQIMIPLLALAIVCLIIYPVYLCWHSPKLSSKDYLRIVMQEGFGLYISVFSSFLYIAISAEDIEALRHSVWEQNFFSNISSIAGSLFQKISKNEYSFSDFKSAVSSICDIMITNISINVLVAFVLQMMTKMIKRYTGNHKLPHTIIASAKFVTSASLYISLGKLTHLFYVGINNYIQRTAVLTEVIVTKN
jgi:hypothetical protein